MDASVSIEAVQEHQVQEISYDGQEIYAQPLSMSENLTKLAQKIDFGKTDDPNEAESAEEESTELATFQASLWPLDSVRNKLRNMLTEISVLVDVLNIAKAKHYMVLDPVSQEPTEPKPFVVLLQKKEALNGAATIMLKGAERLKQSQGEAANNTSSVSDFHLDLLHMRRSWRLKKTNNAVFGDLSYRTAGSRYLQSGYFEVTKSDPFGDTTTVSSAPGMPQRTNIAKVSIPNELEGISYVHVSIQNDTETIDTCELTKPALHGTIPPSETNWVQKLEAAQNVLFCKELFSQLAHEAVQMQTSIPNLVVGNKITTSLFPGVQLNIELRHSTVSDRVKISSIPRNTEHKPVLEHSLHQLLWGLHYNSIHHPMPHPAATTLGISKRQRLAGPNASDRHTIMESVKYEFLLEQIICHTRHMVLRLRTMYMIDTLVCEIKDPLIVAHWMALNSPSLSSVKINIMTHGYEAICRTPLVIHIKEKNLLAICRDGRTMELSHEAQELRNLLLNQVSQHQVNAAQALSKLMGWKVLSTCNHVGIGTVEPIANASSVLMASPAGDRIIAVRAGPRSGIQVSISYSSQQQDCYPSTLVRNRKWQNLTGSFREVCWEKMEGRNFLNKLELLMASLTSC